ncbi:MAG: glutathione S- transferase, nitrogen catabolite repression regulator [Chaenotheca gracillima]|nr:MAG: glutathione S- transferase, nitrogen catabolite repression regulator [Chaenotheca gracillima]
MLLDEDPATLIHHTIGNFNTHPDKHALGRINDSLSTLQQSRELRIREAETALRSTNSPAQASHLRELARNLSSIQTHHSETVTSHASADHASQIVALDTQKFRIAKAASDLEIESERLEQELEGLKGKLAELEMQGVEGGEAERGKRGLEDATLLRLKLYRSLGIEVEADESGNYNKAVIRNNRKGDVHVVNIDPKFSRFFYANYFWQTM